MIKLLRDITIPAGTVLYEAPIRTTRSAGHYQAIIGLTVNTSGTFTYFFEGMEAEELEYWFEEMEDED